MEILGKISPLSAFFIVVGIYFFLLGCKVQLPPKVFQGKVSILILGILVLLFAGSGTAMTLMAPSIQQYVLDEIKQQVRVPVQIDDKMRIDDITVEGEHVVYHISLNTTEQESRSLTGSLKQHMDQACQQSDFRIALERGVTVETRFTDTGGTQLDPIIINPTDCNFKQ